MGSVEIGPLQEGMMFPSCVKCGQLMFEIVEATPARSNFKLMFVQCAMCGAVVGVMDYDNIGARLRKQDEAIKKIAQKLGVHVDL
jgi:hypothetical protein